MTTLRRVRLIAPFALLLLLGVGCKNGTNNEIVPSAPATEQAFSGNAVTIKGFSFSPPTIRIKAGSTVTWKNEHGATHTATAADGSFDTGKLVNGQIDSHTFTAPGTYPYKCAIHPAMKGTVIVE